MFFYPNIEKLVKKKDVDGLIEAMRCKTAWLGELKYIFISYKIGEEPSIVDAFLEIGEPSVEPLIRAMRDGDSWLRQRAAEALDRLAWEPKTGSERADHSVAHKRWDLCVEIGSAAVSPLIAVLRDKDSEVRKAAVEALGIIEDRRAVVPLITALEDKDRGVRMAAAEALGKLGEERVVVPLTTALEDKDRGVRMAAAEALGKLGDERVVGPLIQAMRDAEEEKISNFLDAVRGGSPAKCRIQIQQFWDLLDALHEILKGGEVPDHWVPDPVDMVYASLRATCPICRVSLTGEELENAYTTNWLGSDRISRPTLVAERISISKIISVIKTERFAKERCPRRLCFSRKTIVSWQPPRKL